MRSRSLTSISGAVAEDHAIAAVTAEMFEAIDRTRAFGKAIAEARTKAHIDQRALAHIGRISYSDVRGIEAGSVLVAMRTFGRMAAAIPQIRHMRAELRAIHALVGTPDAAPANEPASPEEPLPFTDALRTSRIRDGLEQEEVGELVGVTNQAVSAWETGRALPVREHFDSLVALWPELAASEPGGILDIRPPHGGRRRGARGGRLRPRRGEGRRYPAPRPRSPF